MLNWPKVQARNRAGALHPAAITSRGNRRHFGAVRRSNLRGHLQPNRGCGAADAHRTVGALIDVDPSASDVDRLDLYDGFKVAGVRPKQAPEVYLDMPGATDGWLRRRPITPRH
jgi:hypothetical protein